MQLDFFSDQDAVSPPADKPAASEPYQTKDRLAWAKSTLLEAFEGRKIALKVLEENKAALEGLLLSIWNVACAKRLSYDQAMRGQERSSFGWANSPLAADIAILSSFQISTGQIPMSPGLTQP